jgi:hypothetical protein
LGDDTAVAGSVKALVEAVRGLSESSKAWGGAEGEEEGEGRMAEP